MARILVVEDDQPGALIVERMLTRIGGHEVRVAQSPEAVIEQVRQGQVDALLLGVSLSDSTYRNDKIDGLRLCQILKSEPATAAVPVILLTAHAMRGDRERFLERSHANAYMTKPILDYRALCQMIQNLIEPPLSLESASESESDSPAGSLD